MASQQSELEEILRPLEEPLAGAPPPDAERERIYSLAETLDAQLQRMSDDLREVIEHINSANKSRDDSEPLVQISKVLNAHMVRKIICLLKKGSVAGFFIITCFVLHNLNFHLSS